jgi:hypothetical protein
VGLDGLGVGVQLVLVHDGQLADLAHNGAGVARFDNTHFEES